MFLRKKCHLPNVQGDVAQAISKIPAEAYAALEAERPVALELLDQIEHGDPYYMMIPMILVIVLSFMAVSYTHLDVYKRQVILCVHTDAHPALTVAVDSVVGQMLNGVQGFPTAANESGTADLAASTGGSQSQTKDENSSGRRRRIR